MTIRQATRDDLPQIRRLYRELLAVEAALQPKYIQVEDLREDYLIEALGGGKRAIFAAVEEGRMLGFALMQEMQTPDVPCMVSHRYGSLMDLVADPAVRGRGIGSALLAAFRDWGRERKLDYLEVTPLSNNEGAVRLYGREGFQPSVLTMRMEL